MKPAPHVSRAPQRSGQVVDGGPPLQPIRALVELLQPRESGSNSLRITRSSRLSARDGSGRFRRLVTSGVAGFLSDFLVLRRALVARAPRVQCNAGRRRSAAPAHEQLGASGRCWTDRRRAVCRLPCSSRLRAREGRMTRPLSGRGSSRAVRIRVAGEDWRLATSGADRRGRSDAGSSTTAQARVGRRCRRGGR